MHTNSPLCLAKAKQRGFTLIELIVVVAIIAVMTSMAVVSVGSLSFGSPVKDEARRLELLINTIADETVITGFDLGLRFDQRGYEFYRLGEGKDGKPTWLLYTDDPRFERHELDEVVGLSLRVDELEVVLPEWTPPPPEEPSTDRNARIQLDSDTTEEQDKVKPNIMLLSSGEVLQTFAISLTHQEDTAVSFIVQSGEERLVELIDESV